MSSATTTQQVNTTQLHDLLGVTSLTVLGSDTDPSRTVIADVDQATLDSVLTAYVYDPNYVAKNATPSMRNAATIRQRALDALTANNNYLAIPTPTTQQMRDQLAAVTRECSGLIRLLLNHLDTTSGT